MPPERTYTPSEAAVLSDLPLSVVHKAIDAGPLGKSRSREPGKRILAKADVIYLATMSIVDPKLMQLSDQAKEQVWKTISSVPKARKIMFSEGFSLDLTGIVARVRTT